MNRCLQIEYRPSRTFLVLQTVLSWSRCREGHQLDHTYCDIPADLTGRTGTCFRRTGTKALVLSRLDYCNSLLAGLPASAIKPLQRIQTAAARLVFNLPKSSHVTPLFRDLQRLPVAARITFKTTVPTYKAVNGTAPTHLRALVRPHAPARALRVTTSAGRYRHP
ncbi:hypothetical protein N1851_007971 [Merluccius polli]|uniref:Uncharacterized protein n=1 Tax=Merluccius polli TaxID=89951 RepID=A0AA47P851_MERPO|nr:hypothetical protein N1851_007971 [Merluccius polli]